MSISKSNSYTPDIIQEERESIIRDANTAQTQLENIIQNLKPEDEIEMALLYLDQKDLVRQIISLDLLSQLLFSHWKKTESLNQINPAHCKRCEYSGICKKGETSLLC